MTTIIKAGTYSIQDERSHIISSTSGKALVCVTNISVKKHLTCHTQTWIVKSAFGHQRFHDFQLAYTYYERLPDPRAG